jgi:serine protease AprX
MVLLAFLLPLTSPSERAPRAQPLALQVAAERPDARVSIIVQKQTQGRQLEELVAARGGTITKDLHIINAFAAELPAREIPVLAMADGVRWVSLDGLTRDTSCQLPCLDTTNLQNAYTRAVGADRLWNEAPAYLQGQNIGVAVVDSGIANHQDFGNGILAAARFNSNTNSATDQYGHGTHVAGIIAGDGSKSNGAYMGIAPRVNLINVKVSDDQGAASTSDVVNGLQWVNDNRSRYNIRVVNLSLNAGTAESYNTSALDAATEILWFNGIVVVTSVGNNGSDGLIYPPANDPFVITVGAVDDKGTADVSDDTLASYSAYGTTSDGFSKPDLVAPGNNIVSLLANMGEALAKAHPANIMPNNNYFRMSGTSMSAPVVSGAAALLLQSNPGLNPDQVKYRLMASARPFAQGNGARYLDAYAAVHAATIQTANTGISVSRLLWTGTSTITGSSVNWGSVNWGSVNWGSVNWGSVNWGSVNWGSVSWGSVSWGSDYWGQ